MWGFTIVVLVLMTLAALLFTSTGSKITVEVGDLLWIIIGAFIAGAGWTVGLMFNFVDGAVKRWRNRG